VAEAARFGRAVLSDASLFGLAPRRVCLATECCHPVLVGSYPTVSPITCSRSNRFRHRDEPSAGLFSVALVVGSPRLAVSQPVALRCSDFPLASETQTKSERQITSNRPTHSKEPV